MKKLCVLVIWCYSSLVAAQTHTHCTHAPFFLKDFCQRLYTIWNEGHDDLYLSGYAWHNRFSYDPQRVKKYNEAAWGGGLGRGLFDEKGDWRGLYAIGFLDSHRHVQPVVGYDFLKVKSFGPIKAGIGYTLFLTSRVDIYNSIPFPGLLPWAGVFYNRVSVHATYIPGGFGAGNVLFLLAKISM